jgi:hypothetical protein
MTIWKHREATHTTHVQPPDVPLDADRLEPRRAAGIALFSGGMFLVAALGASVLVLAAPGLLAGNAFAIIGCAFGLVILVVFGQFGWASANLVLVGWYEYAAFIQEARQTYLAALEARQGLVVTQTRSETSLTLDDRFAVLVLLLEIHRRVQAGEHAAFSVRRLRGRVDIAFARGQQRKLGDISQPQAEVLSDWLARNGFVSGRGPRVAGVWQPRTVDDVETLWRNAQWTN